MSLIITPDYMTYADAVGVLIQQEKAAKKLLSESFSSAAVVSEIILPENEIDHKPAIIALAEPVPVPA